MVRVGIGWDQHRLVEGRPLILGGEALAHPRGLQGHSDADVLTHAVCDALLGALGLGDLGRWFPDDDPQHRNADSLELLARVAEQMHARNLAVGNLDTVIIAQEPRLAGRLESMGANLARMGGYSGFRCDKVARTASQRSQRFSPTGWDQSARQATTDQSSADQEVTNTGVFVG